MSDYNEVPAEAVDAGVAEWHRRVAARIFDDPGAHVAAILAAAAPHILAAERARVFGANFAAALGFTCPRCGMTSYHPRDLQEGYCGNCHDFTGKQQTKVIE
jgi:hypothetical protein